MRYKENDRNSGERQESYFREAPMVRRRRGGPMKRWLDDMETIGGNEIGERKAVDRDE